MAAHLKIEWSELAVLQLDNFYNYLLVEWSLVEAEQFLDRVQEFELVVSLFPRAFIASKRHKTCRIGLIHKNISAVYGIYKGKIIVFSLVDNRSSHIER